jgi:hypothetical protein
MAYNGSGMSAAGAGAGKDGPAAPTGLGVCFFFFALWVAGVVFLVLGMQQQDLLTAHEPSKWFSTIDGNCKILTVTHMADQRQDRNPFCVDVYEYTFTKPGASTVYISGTEEHQRDKGTKCDSSKQLPAVLKVDQDTKCWQLKDGKTKAEAGKFWSCGNADCIKVIDPQRMYDKMNAEGGVFMLLAYIFLGVGVPGFLAMFFVVYKCHQYDLKKQTESKNEGVSVLA